MQFCLFTMVTGLALPGGAWDAWLLYFAGAVVLALGVRRFIRDEFSHRHGLDRVVALGPMLLAAPIAVFGTEHFVFSAMVAGMVPMWIPGRLFWALFVGVCLVGAALLIATGRFAALAALLLGIMILLFVLLIHLPAVVHAPSTRLLWVVGLRDLAFAGGALSVAALAAQASSPRYRQWLVGVSRWFVGVPIIFLGVEQCLHPELAPGVPLAKLSPAWLPAHALWAFLAGMVFILAGVSVTINRQARMAATWLGVTILVLVLAVYLPIVIANPADIGNGLNYLADTLLLGGSVLALAGAVKISTQDIRSVVD